MRDALINDLKAKAWVIHILSSVVRILRKFGTLEKQALDFFPMYLVMKNLFLLLKTLLLM